ncbi:uncharacterized protein KY384_002755 [Bacidia gigantensis]|uniref:uncharacterized protein n=1 Tax=Bacidia gigantensis TaxID=2732470 RepID=UPI001D04D57D|nr:uncharacterized protein KY384_002755 [Bacidia gigantensis]KAG8532877.1 hypothetical protein KY384_002755 [Bacidia gigantensis]
MPSTSPPVSLLTASKVILPLLSVLGYYLTHYLIAHNGTVDRMVQIRDVGPRLLPGTSEPVRTVYTGIPYIDDQLGILTVIFWEQVDGSRPDASLFAFYFGAQIFPAWGVIMVEGLRKANRGRLISYTAVWGMLMQMFAMACVVPIMLLLHLFTSPTVTSTNPEDFMLDASDILTIYTSLAIGLVAPSFLMALAAPTVISFDTKQILIAVWQFFPLWVGIAQQVPSLLLKRDEKNSRNGKIVRGSVRAMRFMYGALLAHAAYSLLSTFQSVGISEVFPDLFSAKYQGVWNFRRVFIPKAITPAVKVDSIGSGFFQLLQYDYIIGSVAVVLWGVTLSRLRIGWTSLALGVAALAIAGPMGLLVVLIWTRDETIFGQQEEGKKDH